MTDQAAAEVRGGRGVVARVLLERQRQEQRVEVLEADRHGGV